MKLHSHCLKAVTIAGLALTGVAVQTTPSFAAGTASATCEGVASITAIRPAGPVTLPQADASGYSPWTTDYFTMQVDSRGRFFVQCLSLAQQGGGLGNFSLPHSERLAVRCADHSNVVKVRRAPNSRIEFQCYAHDHRH